MDSSLRMRIYRIRTAHREAVGQYNPLVNKPTLVYHADWGSKPSKRWCATATLGTDGHYTASGPALVSDDLSLLIENLRAEAGEQQTVFAGFDLPIGVPAHFAERAGIAKFRDFLLELGKGEWSDFHSVCDTPEQLSIHRPFYPNQSLEGHKQQHLLDAHDAKTMLDLLRICERGGNGQRQACSLFWTLGAKAVGKAALKGWEHVLVPALKDNSVLLWPFDGRLDSLLKPGVAVIAETYPAECYGWFSDRPLGSKGDPENRKKFSALLSDWAGINKVLIEDGLRKEMRDGFITGDDDAFDAVVGLFGMLRVCLGQRPSGEPNDKLIRDVEGWILGRRGS
jgi:hypothetical protein